MKKKNIIYITSDECKASALPAYGNCDVQTPNITKLSQEGALFEKVFTVMPKCVPSRCAMVTGRYPHSEGHRTLPGFQLSVNEDNIISILKDNGYKTGLFGKNHVVDPERLDFFFSDYQKEFCPEPETIKIDTAECTNPEMGRAMFYGNFVSTYDKKDAFDVRLGCEFIEKNKDNPFFLMMDIGSPHPAYECVEPFYSELMNKDITLPETHSYQDCPPVLKAYRDVYDIENLSSTQKKKIVASYYSMVSHADRLVGEIMHTVEKLGLSDDTIIIFTADHGDFALEHGAIEKYDTMFYECLVHIPLIIKCPGLTGGAVHSCLVENIDIPATILDFTGINANNQMHGKSLAGILKGTTTVHKTEVFSEGGVEPAALDKSYPYNSEKYIEKPNYYCKQKVMVDFPFTMQRSKMIRTEKWKYIYRRDGSAELYDLEKDPGEKTNLSACEEYKELMGEMREKLLIRCIDTETDYPRVINMFA